MKNIHLENLFWYGFSLWHFAIEDNVWVSLSWPSRNFFNLKTSVMWTRLMLWNILTCLGTVDFLPHELKTFHAFVVYICLSVFNFDCKISFCYLVSVKGSWTPTASNQKQSRHFPGFRELLFLFSFFLEHRYFVILLFYYSKLIVSFFLFSEPPYSWFDRESDVSVIS